MVVDLFRSGIGRAVGAVATTTENRQVRAVEDETVVRKQLRRQRFDEGRRVVGDASARVADDVDVVVLGRSVGRSAVLKMRVAHEVEFLEQIEGAVDGCQVDAWYRVGDLLGRRVAEIAHGREDEFALWRDAQAARVQRSPEVHILTSHPHHRR